MTFLLVVLEDKNKWLPYHQAYHAAPLTTQGRKRGRRVGLSHPIESAKQHYTLGQTGPSLGMAEIMRVLNVSRVQAL